MFISVTIFPESSSSNSSPDVKRKDYGEMELPLKRGNDIIYPLCKQGEAGDYNNMYILL